MADEVASIDVEMEMEYPLQDRFPSSDCSPVGLPCTADPASATSAVSGTCGLHAEGAVFSSPTSEAQLVTSHLFASSPDSSSLLFSSPAPRSLSSSQVLHRVDAVAASAPCPSLVSVATQPFDISSPVTQPHSFFLSSFAFLPLLAASSALVGPHASYLPSLLAKEDFQPVYSSVSPSFLCPVISQHGGFELNWPNASPRVHSSYENLQATHGQEEAPAWASPPSQVYSPPQDDSACHHSSGAPLSSQSLVSTTSRTPSFAHACGASTTAPTLMYLGCVLGAYRAGYSAPLSGSEAAPSPAEGSSDGGFARRYDLPDASPALKASGFMEDMDSPELVGS
ncbi:hypothetical protein O6H91_03G064900 [Diphasiastrum complanatum]|uniref:Uncharacterized protein n=1 Tax=Diphasiastrum complanatum TaxID=34168 RepID=A0ACC2E6V9_DIPCM|nr:hypothetical protein O6H91_03G064900 [Diphasiastrum complanatum]